MCVWVPVLPLPRHSWLGFVVCAVGCVGVVPRQWLRSLWVQFPANLGSGLLLAVMGWSLASPR